MKLAFSILFTIAEELAELARTSVPKLRDGEKVTREWLDNGVYHRESVLNGAVFHAGYDFRRRKVI